jgi:hypothetical protein
MRLQVKEDKQVARKPPSFSFFSLPSNSQFGTRVDPAGIFTASYCSLPCQLTALLRGVESLPSPTLTACGANAKNP